MAGINRELIGDRAMEVLEEDHLVSNINYVFIHAFVITLFCFIRWQTVWYP